jgi:hypothetical protein
MAFRLAGIPVIRQSHRPGARFIAVPQGPANVCSHKVYRLDRVILPVKVKTPHARCSRNAGRTLPSPLAERARLDVMPAWAPPLTTLKSKA